MTKVLPVGVIGVGHLGTLHLKKYMNLESAKVVGVWDIDDNQMDKINEEFNLKTYDSLDALLSKVEAVSIVVPTVEHYKTASKAIAKGVHVFVEKPIASTVAEAEKIIIEAKEKGVKLQVGHIERFNPAYRNLRHDLITPKFVESHRLASFNPRGLDVSVILDLLIHDIDIILNLVQSPVKNIDASGVGVVSETSDIVNARLTFENGAVANVTASRISQKKMRRMRIFQKDSYIAMDFVEGTAEVFRMSDPEGKFEQADISPVMDLSHNSKKRIVGYRRVANDGKDAIEMELGAFLDSIIHDTDPPVSGEEGKQALEIAMDIIGKIGS